MTNTDSLAPHNLQAEEAVLGSILMNPECLLDVLPFLKADEFYLIAHQHIYATILALYDRGEPLDPVILAQELATRGHLETAGGFAYVSSLSIKTPSSLNVEGYARIVQQLAWRRRLIAFASEASRLAHTDSIPIAAIHQQIVGKLNHLSSGALRGPRTMRDLASDFIDEVQAAFRDGPPQPFTTGFAMLDQLFDGAYGPLSMTVIGGYTSQGKTQIAAQMAMHAAEQAPALYVTLESSPQSIFNRLVAVRSGVSLTLIMQRDLGDEDRLTRCTQAASELSALPLEIETLESVADIEGYVADMSIRYGFQPGMVFVDDVDSLAESTKGNSDYERLKRASTALLRLTLRTGWGVVGLKQLLMPKEARGVTSPARLKELLTPSILSFEGGSSISQKGGNVITMLSAEWIQSKVYADFHHTDLQRGHVYFYKHKSREARSDSAVEVPLRFNANVPRYEDVTPKLSARSTPGRRIYGQTTQEVETEEVFP